MANKPVTTKKSVAAPNPAAKKPAATKAPATKAPATKAPATKAPAKKPAATKAPATKAPAKKPAASANDGKAKATSAKAAEVDQTLAKKIMSHLNGCADDVFEHKIRFLSMWQEEGNVFKGTTEDKTLKTGPSAFRFHWPKPLKTADDLDKLYMHIINAIVEDYDDDFSDSGE